MNDFRGWLHAYDDWPRAPINDCQLGTFCPCLEAYRIAENLHPRPEDRFKKLGYALCPVLLPKLRKKCRMVKNIDDERGLIFIIIIQSLLNFKKNT
jgi:hypothetical protein